MRTVILSLDRERLPVQFGVTAGSLVERFFQYAVKVVESAISTAPSDAFAIEVETEFEGVFFTHHEATPATTDSGKDTAWVRNSRNVDWVEIRQAGPQVEQCANILRLRSSIESNDMYFVATSSEEFMTTLILSQTPSF